MTKLTCRDWIPEIVECARNGAQPDAKLESHLETCPKCAMRWEDEQRLSSLLQVAREAAAGQRSREARREEIMRRFALTPKQPARGSWKWVLSAAAVLLMGIALVYVLRSGGQTSTTAPATQQVAVASAEFEEVAGDSSEFVAVAYAPPLATGEFVSVVRTELQPRALARMGIYVDAAYTNPIPADVLVGEDGFPRAVRVVSEVEF